MLPQQILEGALESRLLRRGVPVLWNHRVSELALGHGAMIAEVERLERTEGEHAAVEDRFEVRADFLLGTDGHPSLVRRSLEIPSRTSGLPRT